MSSFVAFGRAILIALSLAVVSTPLLAESTYEVTSEASGGILNMRDGPGTGHAIVTTIPVGSGGISVFECVSGDDRTSRKKWCRSKWEDHSGWISSCCIREVEARETAPPVVPTTKLAEADASPPTVNNSGRSMYANKKCIDGSSKDGLLHVQNNCPERIAFFYCFEDAIYDAKCKSAPLDRFSVLQLDGYQEADIGFWEKSRGQFHSKGRIWYNACFAPRSGFHWDMTSFSFSSGDIDCGVEKAAGEIEVINNIPVAEAMGRSLGTATARLARDARVNAERLGKMAADEAAEEERVRQENENVSNAIEMFSNIIQSARRR